MKEKMKDVLIRSAKTFWQAVLAYLITAFGAQFTGVGAFDIDALKNAGIGVLVGALAAGLSATWNGVLAPIVNKLTGKGEKPPDPIA